MAGGRPAEAKAGNRPVESDRIPARRYSALASHTKTVERAGCLLPTQFANPGRFQLSVSVGFGDFS